MAEDKGRLSYLRPKPGAPERSVPPTSIREAQTQAQKARPIPPAILQRSLEAVHPKVSLVPEPTKEQLLLDQVRAVIRESMDASDAAE